MIEWIDYFNLMAYDMCQPGHYHHTPLHPSTAEAVNCPEQLHGVQSVEECLKNYLDKGVPKDKIMLGLAFYGRGDGVNFRQWTDYADITLGEGMKECWDSVACVPYIADSTGVLILGYENPQSLELKCQFIKDQGLRGGFYWRAETDTDSLTLASTVASALLEK